MADIKVSGPLGNQDRLGATPRSRSFTGAGSTWGTQAGGDESNDLAFDPPIRGVRVGTAGGGALHVEYVTGDEDTIPALTAGETWRGKIRRVFADSTVQNITPFW